MANAKNTTVGKEGRVTLSVLSPIPGSKKRRKRLGIGEGSGNGKTCGRGHKGQRSRSGGGTPPGFEGGQMPLQRRLPKIGFTSRKKVRGENVFSLVPLSRLNEMEAEGDLTLEILREKGLVRSKNSRVKILGGCSAERKIVVEAHAVSASAKAAIEKAGGEVKIVS